MGLVPGYMYQFGVGVEPEAPADLVEKDLVESHGGSQVTMAYVSIVIEVTRVITGDPCLRCDFFGVAQKWRVSEKLPMGVSRDHSMDD